MELRFLTALLAVSFCATALFSVYHNAQIIPSDYAMSSQGPELSHVPATVGPGGRTAN
jgi:hypothetical protein